MKQGAPWSIKGVDADAREIAKAKATAAGMTLGQWLNRAIADADRPVAPPPAPPAAGTALDTARLMRAIAEVARRVDQIRPADEQAPPLDTAQLEKRLSELAAAVDSAPMEKRLSELAAAVDTASLEARLSELAATVDLLAHREPPPPATLSLSPIERRLDALAERMGEMEGLKAAVDALGQRMPDADLPPPLAPRLDEQAQDLRRIMNGLINLGRKIDLTEQKLAEQSAPLAERLAALEDRLAGIEARAGDPASLAAVVAAIEQLQTRPATERPAAAQPEVVPAPEVAQVQEPAPAREADVMPAGHAGPQPDPVTKPVGPTPVDAPDLPPPAAPEPATPPAELAALHDLTSRRDAVSSAPLRGRAGPVFHDLPPFDEAGDASAPADDDRPAFDAPPPDRFRDLADLPEPAAASPPVASGPPLRAVPPGPADAAPPRGQGLPDDALPPDRPRRLVAIESLLEDAGAPPPRPAAPPAPGIDDDEWQVPGGGVAGPTPGYQVRAEAVEPPVRSPLEQPVAPQRRRRAPAPPAPGKGGYLVAALLILGLLVGGFLVAGSPVIDDIVQAVDDLAGLARPEVSSGDASASADVATSPAATVTAPVRPVEPVPPAARPDRPAPSTATTSAAEPAAPKAAPPTEASERAAAASPPAPVVPVPVAPAPVAPAAVAAAPVAPVPAPPVSRAPVSELADLLERAEGGEAEAQFALGLRYRDGEGVSQSYREAARWFDAAANSGHVAAQMNLGVMYRQGVGVPKDVDLARVWLHAAARAGNPEAQKYLGEVYAQDDQGTPDYFQAARWFREAAEQGVVDAQYNMGVLYEGGLGVPRDLGQAYYWFGLAARMGDAVAGEDQSRLAAQVDSSERTALDERIAGFRAVRHSPESAAAPAGSGATTGGNRAEITRRDQIRELQQLLVARGYDPGTPDGLPGERTREAIRAFQADRGLPVDGRISEQVLQQLQSTR